MADHPGCPEDLRRKGKGAVLMAPVALLPKGGTRGIFSVGAGGEYLKCIGESFQKMVPDFEKSPGGDPVGRFGKDQEPPFREVIESGFQGDIKTAFFVCLFRQDIGFQKKIERLFHPRDPGQMQHLCPDNPSVPEQGPDDFLRQRERFPGAVQQADFQAPVFGEHRQKRREDPFGKTPCAGSPVHHPKCLTAQKNVQKEGVGPTEGFLSQLNSLCRGQGMVVG